MAKKKASKPAAKKSGKKSGKTSKGKPSVAALASVLDEATVAHTRCFTDPSAGERWTSWIGPSKQQPDGSFFIGDGPNFQGHHSTGKSVTGNCLGSGMRIILPAARGIWLYEGDFKDDVTVIGTRTFFGFQLNAVAPAPPLPDDWEADKTT